MLAFWPHGMGDRPASLPGRSTVLWSCRFRWVVIRATSSGSSHQRGDPQTGVRTLVGRHREVLVGQIA
jgi:hypothetical protein